MIENGTRVRSYDDVEDAAGTVGTVFNPMTTEEKDLFVDEKVDEVWYWVLTDPREGTTFFFAESELEVMK